MAAAVVVGTGVVVKVVAEDVEVVEIEVVVLVSAADVVTVAETVVTFSGTSSLS